MRFSRLISAVSILALTALLFTACSDDDDPTTPPPPTSAEATIGDTGGTLEIPDKIALEIPAGALGADVDFSVEQNDTPRATPDDYTLVSKVYTIEPSNTEFFDFATLTIDYKESLLGGAEEGDIVIFCDEGSGWEARRTAIDEENNKASIPISHLSDYMAAVETYVMPTGVHAELEVHREFNTGTKADIYHETTDTFEAAFQSGSGGSPYVQADDVSFGSWYLSWDGEDELHRYENQDVLTAGQSYDFVINGNADVPPLTQSVTIFDVEPIMSAPTWSATLPMTGFEVTWEGATSGGTINLVLEGTGETVLDLDVPNTGSYTYTEAQLDAVGTGAGTVGLFLVNETPITATGFDGESVITQRTSHVVPVTFSRETVISEYNGSSTPNIAIPDGPSGGGSGAAATDVINVPVSGAVDSMRVYIDANHDYSSDLIIRLRSPEGTEARVMFIGEGGEPNNGGPQGWYPGDYTPKDDLSIFDGDQVNGNWTIDARDYSNGDSGTLVEWRLQIFYAE